MSSVLDTLKHNRTRTITIAAITLLFLMAIQSMDTKDWVITVMRGLSVGMLVFLVASGLSLIFGLMDVLNLAHGEFFMLGAYVGWTVFVRPDTFIDVLPMGLLLSAGLVLMRSLCQNTSQICIIGWRNGAAFLRRLKILRNIVIF